MNQPAIDDQVIDFFAGLFRALFYAPVAGEIPTRLKRNKVERAVGDAADAASQSITRLLRNEQLTPAQTAAVLAACDGLASRLDLERIGNVNIPPESITEDLLNQLPAPAAGADERLALIHRVTLHSLVQVLTLVGPVMAEWQRVGFADTFEVLRRVVDRLNRMNESLDVLGRAGREAQDERFELSYRDYLAQRFHRVEAGTVKMTTNLAVDLRELFVMPRVLPRKANAKADPGGEDALMDLSLARRRFSEATRRPPPQKKKGAEPVPIPAQGLLSNGERWVFIGAPGSGKSTFFEWVQIEVATVTTELVLAGKQAIPLLLRVRQLDPARLPVGAGLIQVATGSTDLARLAPHGWMNRMLAEGRVLWMLDGLDEVDPEQLGARIIPWLADLVARYPNCRYLISSRPSGYPAGSLRPLAFAEADLLDFDAEAIAAYTCHWCTAVRLARNEQEVEARRDGEADGDAIVAGFRDHPYINDLARSPLMLSAICLVNWFEGGQLPADRAMLYRLCVEGLLHHWDQRRGIHSDFGLDEKLRVCREVAIAMQADDRAECAADQVGSIIAEVLGDAARGALLLEHIRHRTGLLIERRPVVFAFAHLTFQEYLAALAVHEGNRRGVTVDQLVAEHADPRWREVLPLYAGAGTDASARALIEALMVATDTGMRGALLADAYLAAERGLKGDQALRQAVLELIAGSRASGWPPALQSFPTEEIGPIANCWLGRRADATGLNGAGGAFKWLVRKPPYVDRDRVWHLLRNWRKIEHPAMLADVVVLAHRVLDSRLLDQMADDSEIYRSAGPTFDHGEFYVCQGELALIGLDGNHRPITSWPRRSVIASLEAIRECWTSLLPPVACINVRSVLAECESEANSRGLPTDNLLTVIGALSESDDPRSVRDLSGAIDEVKTLFAILDQEPPATEDDQAQ